MNLAFLKALALHWGLFAVVAVLGWVVANAAGLSASYGAIIAIVANAGLQFARMELAKHPEPAD